MSALPIVPLADLVAELRTLPTIYTPDGRAVSGYPAADFLAALPELPLCPTCGGETAIWSADSGLRHAIPCPDCVDGHVTWQWLVNVFNAVWDDAEKDRVPTPLSARGTAVLYTFDTGVDRAFDHLRAVR